MLAWCPGLPPLVVFARSLHRKEAKRVLPSTHGLPEKLESCSQGLRSRPGTKTWHPLTPCLKLKVQGFWGIQVSLGIALCLQGSCALLGWTPGLAYPEQGQVWRQSPQSLAL